MKCVEVDLYLYIQCIYTYMFVLYICISIDAVYTEQKSHRNMYVRMHILLILMVQYMEANIGRYRDV